MLIRATWRCSPAFRVALSDLILILREGQVYDLNDDDAATLIAMGWGERVLVAPVGERVVSVPEEQPPAPETTTAARPKRKR